MKNASIVLFFAICFAVFAPAMATDYYVATNGSDGNDGTIASPLKTIQYGVDQLSAGDTLHIRGGSYHESVTISNIDGGAQTAWISGDGWQDQWSRLGDTQLHTYDNNQSALLRRTGSITRTLANGITNGTLSFKWDVDSLDSSSEKGIAEVYDGSWHTVWEVDNTANGSDVNPQADNLQTASNISLSAYGQITQLRFRIAASGTGDAFFVDDISISGTGGAASHDFEDSMKLLITNYQNEEVVLDGTVAVAGTWTQHSGSIYKTTIPQDIWQLFVDGEMQTSARWPDSEAWTSATWDKDTNWIQQDATSSDGTFVDEIGGQDLAGSGKDFTGAIAIMNVGSWLSFARTVNTHSAGSNTFTYDLIGSKYHDKIANGSAFLEAAYACLSTNKEWYYNSSTDELFLIADDGLDPTGRDIRGKTITYGLDILNSQNITVRGIDFFACTARVTNSSKIAIEHCDAMFPSYSKRMLGSTAKAEPTMIDGTTNTLRNCTFSYADGTGVEFVGDGGLIENCLFYHIDYSCVGTLHDVMINVRGTSNLIFRNNTLDTGGNSVGIKGGPNGLFEYNIVTNQGMLQHDGSAIQADADYADGTIMQNNWIHDHIKFSLRFDSPWLDTTVYGTNGIMRNNVIWNTRPMVPKGDYHHIYGNTGFDNDIVDISIFADITHGGWNTNTTTRNNAVNVISGERSLVEPYPGTSGHNWVGIEFDPDRDVKTQLNDPDQLDFRPAAGSDLIDAGLDVPAHVTSFVGTAPDIGAYEYDSDEYWIPGRKLAKASVAIPSNGAVEMPLNRDLIFLIGFEGVSADVYLGLDYNAVLNATDTSPEHKTTLPDPQNIYTPDIMQGSTTYYWRVDTILADQSVITGDVWSFTTESGPTEMPVLTEPANAAVDLIGPVTLAWTEGFGADHHDLYISNDFNLVNDLDASVRITDVTSGYAAIGLDLQSDYFWCVAAVNASGTLITPSVLWTFTTGDYAVVDNFETGLWTASGGAVVTAETGVVYAGTGSMRIDYTAGISTATKTFTPSRNWTTSTNRAALQLMYKGWDTNAPGSLIVELSDGTLTDSVVLTDDGSTIDDPNPLVNGSYRNFAAWDIDLADFNVNLANIESIAIKVDSPGSGKVYIDNVHVYAPRCVPAKIPGDIVEENCTADVDDIAELSLNWLAQTETVTEQVPGDAGLLAHWDFEGDYVDEVSGWTLTPEGSPSLTTDAPAIGGANALNCSSLGKLSNSADAGTILASVTDTITISFWAKCNINIDPITGLIDQYYAYWFHGLSTNAPGGNTQTNVYAQLPRKNGDISFGGGGEYLAQPVEDSAFGNEWNHYATVLDQSADTKKIYINGILRDVNDTTNLLDGTATAKLNIGGNNVSDYWHGMIDEFRIYDKALTQNEIVSLANKTFVVQPLMISSDITNDNTVNLADFVEIANSWLTAPLWP